MTVLPVSQSVAPPTFVWIISPAITLIDIKDIHGPYDALTLEIFDSYCCSSIRLIELKYCCRALISGPGVLNWMNFTVSNDFYST